MLFAAGPEGQRRRWDLEPGDPALPVPAGPRRACAAHAVGAFGPPTLSSLFPPVSSPPFFSTPPHGMSVLPGSLPSRTRAGSAQFLEPRGPKEFCLLLGVRPKSEVPAGAGTRPHVGIAPPGSAPLWGARRWDGGVEASGAAPSRGPAARPVPAAGGLAFEDRDRSIWLRVLSTYHDLAPSRPCVGMKGADRCLWSPAWTECQFCTLGS